MYSDRFFENIRENFKNYLTRYYLCDIIIIEITKKEGYGGQ